MLYGRTKAIFGRPNTFLAEVAELVRRHEEETRAAREAVEADEYRTRIEKEAAARRAEEEAARKAEEARLRWMALSSTNTADMADLEAVKVLERAAFLRKMQSFDADGDGLIRRAPATSAARRVNHRTANRTARMAARRNSRSTCSASGCGAPSGRTPSHSGRTVLLRSVRCGGPPGTPRWTKERVRPACAPPTWQLYE
jgi:hypothetical protein